ncbi:MAG: hypothetical protein AAGG09_06025 [Pseudomonadota bacterium]
MKPKQICFVHIPSCGGTTFISLLNAAYGGKNSIRIKDARKALEQDADPASTYAGKDSVAGHFGYSFANRWFPDRAKITLLRDPIERLQSQMNRHLRRGRLNRKNIDKLISPETIGPATHKLAFYLSDAPTPHGEKLPQVDGDPDEIVEACVRSLKDNFVAFGFQERFDETMFMFADALGWKEVPTYDKRNYAASKDLLLSDEQRETLREKLSIEMAIFERAKALFDERWAALSERLPEGALEAYRARLEERRHRLEAEEGADRYSKAPRVSS